MSVADFTVTSLLSTERRICVCFNILHLIELVRLVRLISDAKRSNSLENLFSLGLPVLTWMQTATQGFVGGTQP